MPSAEVADHGSDDGVNEDEAFHGDDGLSPNEVDAWLDQVAASDKEKVAPQPEGAWWEQGTLDDTALPPSQEAEAPPQEEEEVHSEREADRSQDAQKAQEELQQCSKLFADMGDARRITFAIDISGSMHSDVNNPGYMPPEGGTSRMDVVKKHLIRVVQAMEAVPR